MTRRDPWVNMLRTTIACFAAAVGGADAITVLPFDAAIGLPDDFARRIARNTQSSCTTSRAWAGSSTPPAAPGTSSRSPTSSRDAAWDAFTAIERAGGALAALDDGTIGEPARARRRERARRRRSRTGARR